MREDPVALAKQLEETRRLTLWLADLCDDDELRRSPHADFSPVGWHLGHIAAFEDLWVATRGCDQPPLNAHYLNLFDPRSIPKKERGELPSRASLLRYLQAVRGRTMELLATCAMVPREGLCEDLYAFRFVLAHEQQHAETIATVLRMRPAERRAQARCALPEGGGAISRERLVFGGTAVHLGTTDPREGYDNEVSRHRVWIDPFALDAQPATNGAWRAFLEEGGYRRRSLWSREGWIWLEKEEIERPSTWTADGALKAFGGDVELPLAHPVEGISWYEAEAFARWRGGRLPSEKEWEHAARTIESQSPHVGLACGGTRAVGQGADLLGNVWEWTESAFAPFPGFQPFPYEGYSQPYFDGRHRVLRGGSWATQARIARPGFRNWYEPHWRAMFAGVRVAYDG